MDEIKMSLEEMISALDTAAGMLIVTAMRDKTVKKAMETITQVSIALGEIEEIKFYDYNDDEEE